jgi:hypothetical protein
MNIDTAPVKNHHGEGWVGMLARFAAAAEA